MTGPHQLQNHLKDPGSTGRRDATLRVLHSSHTSQHTHRLEKTSTVQSAREKKLIPGESPLQSLTHKAHSTLSEFYQNVLPKALRTRVSVNGFTFREPRSKLAGDAGFLKDPQAFWLKMAGLSFLILNLLLGPAPLWGHSLQGVEVVSCFVHL